MSEFPNYEAKWQQRWKQRDRTTTGDPYYLLSMFPYPSGKLHFGHALPYTLTDSMARYQRMRGRAVMNPMGWDAFGLPAENAAIERNIHPRISTMENIDTMRAQMDAFGYDFDWEREVFTCREDYYKWTQWIFTKMLDKGVAYRKNARINWCPHDKTVLANEQVETHIKDGEEYSACFRCGTKVEPRDINAWFLRITDYADRLLDGLDKLGDDWPERVTSQQRYWIGRSEGVEIAFSTTIGDATHALPVFTTRADTVFGVTFVALAVEHPLVATILKHADDATAKRLHEFIAEVESLSEIERSAGNDKQGVDTGFKVVNPLNGEESPLYLANYVLMYGTGAVMAVPAHDERDHQFAQDFKMPIKQVIEPSDGGEIDLSNEAFTGRGVLVNSGDYTGMTSDDAIAKIAADLEAQDKGGTKVNYKLRDWGVSRQRYWGCPIPVIHCEDCGIVPVPESDLPVKLPEDVDFLPTGQSPLTLHPDFQRTTCPKCGREDAKRDTDTMDTFVDSSWYFLRYTDPNNAQAIFDEAKVKEWAPVDMYIGGREHAILHLIYARFFTHFLHDIGLIDFEEPFTKMYAHGLIQGESMRVINANMTRYVDRKELDELVASGEAKESDVTRRIEKMSKSKKNGADVTALVDEYGADAVRLTILFLGPGDADSVWDPNGIKGPSGFLKRWFDTTMQYRDIVEGVGGTEGVEFGKEAKVLRASVHGLIDKVTNEFEGRYAFNTAIAKGMELVNDVRQFVKDRNVTKDSDDVGDRAALAEALRTLVTVLAPFAPHTGEELWEALGGTGSVFEQHWPEADSTAMQLDTIEIPVTVNGKVRATITVGRDADKASLEASALADENVKRAIGDNPVRKVIAVPGRIVNVVAK